MNPLIVLFFISIILEDYLFKEGIFMKYYLFSLFIYLIIYFISNSKNYLESPYRKFLLAAYSQSYDPTVYGVIKPDIHKVKLFLEKFNKTHSENKLNLTLFFTKLIGVVMNKFPTCNNTIKYGKHCDRGRTDISIIIENENELGFITLRDVDKKSIPTLCDELSSIKINNFTKKDRLSYLLNYLPSYLIALVIECIGYISNMGIYIPYLGIESNQYGSILISNIGTFNIITAYSPLIPSTYTCGVLTLGAIYIKKTLNIDGTITESEILPIHLSIDHRYADGVLAAKMIKMIKYYFENPEELI